MRTALALMAALTAASAIAAQEAGDRPKMLAQLAQSSKAGLPALASSFKVRFPGQTAQLALDLIVYRWAGARPATRRNPEIPAADLPNADAIISSLAKVLGDPTVNWALRTFSPTSDAREPGILPPQDDERARLLADFRREHSSATNQARQSPIESVRALTNALDLAQKARLDICQAIVRLQLGNQYFRLMHRYGQAANAFGWAANTFSGYQLLASGADAYGDLGALQREVGSLTDAVASFTLAARYYVRLAERDPGQPEFRRFAGRDYMRAGRVQISVQGGAYASDALKLMQLALDQYRFYSVASGNYSDLVTTLLEVAKIHQSRNDLARALELQNSAKEAAVRVNEPLLTARAYEALASIYKAQRRESDAAEAARKRVRALEEGVTRGAADLAKLNKSTGLSAAARDNLFRSAERGAAASRELKQYWASAEAYGRIIAAYQRFGLNESRIPALRELAAVFDELGKPDRSLQTRLEAVAIARNAGNNALAAQIGREIVDAFEKKGDLNSLKEGYMDLAPTFAAAGDVRGGALMWERRGKLLADNGQYLDAVEDFEKARQTYITDMDDPWAQGAVSLSLAAAYRSAGKPGEAKSVLESALEAVEGRFASENLDPNTDPERSQTVMNLYRQLAEAYVRENSPEKATRLLQQAKHYSWMPDLIRAMRLSEEPAVASFAASLDILGAPDNSNTSPSVPVSARPLAQGWPDFVAHCYLLQNGFRSNYNALPIYPLELFGARASLPREGLIIEYLPTAASTYVFICGFDRATILQIEVRSSEVSQMVAELRRQIKSLEGSVSAGIPIPRISDWAEPAFAQMRPVLARLYAQLIRPISSDLADRKLLMFALPDEFAGLPMQALISSESSQPPRFLLQDYEIGYLGRGMLHLVTGEDGRTIDTNTDRLAIFADPRDNLPGARREASEIEKVYFKSGSYIGRRANAASLRAEATKAGILHIAAHHRIDPNPAAFALELAPDGDSDGRIGVAELTDLGATRLALVTLSACNSIASSDPISSGPSRAAEILSLAAGAQSVLGGLWKVSDAAAAKVMVDFYRGLSRGLSRTEALRRAQLEVIQSRGSGEFAHPFFWACFALYGNPW